MESTRHAGLLYRNSGIVYSRTVDRLDSRCLGLRLPGYVLQVVCSVDLPLVVVHEHES